jgi:large subunit ribosomal protein L6
MKLKELVASQTFPKEVQVVYTQPNLTIKGKSGEVMRTIFNPRTSIEVTSDTISLKVKQATKIDKMQTNTCMAHIRNMIRGVQKPFVNELKICSGHFPMTVTVKGSEFEVKNFLGEAHPRKMLIKQGVKVQIAGDKITVESPNVELAGQVASDLEQLTRIADRDRRVFQDGIYIIKKDGNPI